MCQDRKEKALERPNFNHSICQWLSHFLALWQPSYHDYSLILKRKKNSKLHGAQTLMHKNHSRVKNTHFLFPCGKFHSLMWAGVRTFLLCQAPRARLLLVVLVIPRGEERPPTHPKLSCLMLGTTRHGSGHGHLVPTYGIRTKDKAVLGKCRTTEGNWGQQVWVFVLQSRIWSRRCICSRRCGAWTIAPVTFPEPLRLLHITTIRCQEAYFKCM